VQAGESIGSRKTRLIDVPWCRVIALNQTLFTNSIITYL